MQTTELGGDKGLLFPCQVTPSYKGTTGLMQPQGHAMNRVCLHRTTRPVSGAHGRILRPSHTENIYEKCTGTPPSEHITFTQPAGVLSSPHQEPRVKEETLNDYILTETRPTHNAQRRDIYSEVNFTCLAASLAPQGWLIYQSEIR